MTRTELNVKHNVDIGKYNTLLAFLKRQGTGYRPKKSKVFTKKQFNDFLKEAPNQIYLATKMGNTFH